MIYISDHSKICIIRNIAKLIKLIPKGKLNVKNIQKKNHYNAL